MYGLENPDTIKAINNLATTVLLFIIFLSMLKLVKIKKHWKILNK